MPFEVESTVLVVALSSRESHLYQTPGSIFGHQRLLVHPK